MIGVGILLFCSLPCAAQQEIARKIDDFVHTEMREQRIPGLALAVIKDGHPIIIKGYGFANIEHHVRVKPETVFQSGSIAKQFTATAVMILAQESKLSLDDKISKYLSDLPESWKNITIRHLLTHTSGMGEYPGNVDTRRDYTEDEFLALIKASPLNCQTGTKWEYSNLGYVTLGILIRKVTGEFYGDFLAERVFQPLGMTTARVISEPDIVPNRGAGYHLVRGELKNQEWVSPSTNTTADGSLYFSILDLTKWDAALYTNTPLKQSSLVQMWTPAKLADGKTTAYGFGWHTDVIHGRRIVFHGGAWQGFKSFIVRFPDEHLSIMFLANLWDTKESRLARGLTAIFYPEFALPPFETIPDDEPQVTRLVRRVLTQAAKGQAEPGDFTPNAQTKIFPDQIRQIGESLNSFSHPVATIHSSELIGRLDENDLRRYRYVMNDLGHTLICTVRLTTGNKIASLKVSLKMTD